jgi:hypothetical protein
MGTVVAILPTFQQRMPDSLQVTLKEAFVASQMDVLDVTPLHVDFVCLTFD